MLIILISCQKGSWRGQERRVWWCHVGAQVLSHSSTGVFLTHCGWNSILESVVNGVPLLAWPLYAEQKINADLVTKDIKVALRPMQGEREEIGSVVKKLMQGEDGKKLRDRMKELKLGAARALAQNGSSTNQISHLALQWQGIMTLINVKRMLVRSGTCLKVVHH
ncbi:UDP-glucuronosyl/UDP-glucosyltransferase [Sesbania bispinosa]|nr:UDP-glucuronosyl/UDP-glucosyltransferase [Sesbania bispinosa]